MICRRPTSSLSSVTVSTAFLLLGLLLAACGGGGGGGDGGFRIEDLNGDGSILVIAFGDSITRGVGDGSSSSARPPVETAGWPARLQQRLSVTVQNQGNPGETTSDGIRRLGQVLAANPSADYVILLEGVNDLLNDHSPSEVAANLRTMVDRVYGAGPQPILGTLTPVCCDHAFVIPESDVSATNEQILLLGEETSAPVVDFFNAFGGLEYDRSFGLLHDPEGLHPAPAGYEVMAEVAEAVLRGRRPPPPPTPAPAPTP